MKLNIKLKMSIKDDQIRRAVDQIFQEFDANQNSYLDVCEVIKFMNNGLRALGRKANATFNDA